MKKEDDVESSITGNLLQKTVSSDDVESSITGNLLRYKAWSMQGPPAFNLTRFQLLQLASWKFTFHNKILIEGPFFKRKKKRKKNKDRA